MTNSDTFSRKERFFARWAPHYDLFFTTIFYQAIHQRLLEYVELPDNSQVLDLGCGTGRLLNRLATTFPNLHGTGLDLSPEMLHQARVHKKFRKRLIFIQGNAESLPFTEGQFDAVFNTISFLHYPHPEQVFSEVGRVLSPHGRFYLVDYIGGEIILHFFRLFAGEIQFYNSQEREQLGHMVGLECLGHHYLLGPIVLTIFTRR